jgi:hypothetical protein
MKRTKFFFFLLVVPIILSAQNKDTKSILRQLPLSIVVPQQSEYLNSQQMQRLGKKTKQVMAKNGLGGVGSQQFILYPEFDILQEQSMDGLINNITVVEAEITFTIMQLDNNVIFNSEAITVTGGGDSKKQAINKAINSINPKDDALETFIENTKTRINSYYSEKCGSIIKDANMLIEAKQYLKAIALLYSIPTVSDCHEKSRENLTDAFILYQEQNCSGWLLKAKAEEGKNNYNKALDYIAKIDPTSSCKNEASDMLKRIGKDVDEQDRKIWEAMERRYSDKVALEEMRIEMVQSVMTEYYKSQQSDFYQFILIH